MRRTLTENILKAIMNGLETTADVVTAILDTPYGSSLTTLERNMSRVKKARVDRMRKARERHHIDSQISKLKKQGFIEQKYKRWKITRRGSEKLTEIQERARRLPEKHTSYPQTVSSSITLITFDVPEKEKYKREWLRSVLKALGFTMLRQSVWIGKSKIPRELLADFRRFKLFPYIDIVAITRSGTIDEIR